MSIDDASISPRKQRGMPDISLGTNRIGYREWTAVEKYKLKGLAERNVPVQKIARSLKRSVGITRSMASKLGIQLPDDPVAPPN